MFYNTGGVHAHACVTKWTFQSKLDLLNGRKMTKVEVRNVNVEPTADESSVQSQASLARNIQRQ